MKKELTKSQVDRQNILNNPLAIEKLQEYLGISGMLFEGEFRFTKAMIAEFYEIDISTVERYLTQYSIELQCNGYKVLKGQKLKQFKLDFAPLINEASKITQLGVFSFRAFLNLGMLLTESEKAKELRSRILDIVLDTLHKKLGGTTKYINQRDEDFLHAIEKEPVYRKEFTSALSQCLEMGNYKYAVYTDKIYKAIFKENAKEYKTILDLEEKENPRDTMYADVLSLIASFESGLAYEIEKLSKEKRRKLKPKELDQLFLDFAEHPLFKPQIQNARTKMASRDYGLRAVIHPQLEQNIKALSKGEFDRFLGEKSKELKERIEENIEVFKRLKDR